MPKSDGKTPQERFNERYVIDPATGCWNWIAGINGKGYAYLWVPDEIRNDKRPGEGRTLQAYKLGWQWKNGAVPTGLDLHHKCENRLCVNPDHLQVLSRKDHLRLRLNSTACRRGHTYTEESTYWTPAGQRSCRICDRAARLKRKGKVQSAVQ